MVDRPSSLTSTDADTPGPGVNPARAHPLVRRPRHIRTYLLIDWGMDMPGLIDVLHFKLATVLLGSVIRLRKDQGEILFHPRAGLVTAPFPSRRKKSNNWRGPRQSIAHATQATSWGRWARWLHRAGPNIGLHQHAGPPTNNCDLAALEMQILQASLGPLPGLVKAPSGRLACKVADHLPREFKSPPHLLQQRFSRPPACSLEHLMSPQEASLVVQGAGNSSPGWLVFPCSPVRPSRCQASSLYSLYRDDKTVSLWIPVSLGSSQSSLGRGVRASNWHRRGCCTETQDLTDGITHGHKRLALNTGNAALCSALDLFSAGIINRAWLALLDPSSMCKGAGRKS